MSKLQRIAGTARSVCLCGGIAASSVVFGAERATAGDLSDFVTDLYGGNGITLAPEGGHQGHFLEGSLEAFDQLGSAISSQISTFSLTSPVTSFVYDVEQGVPVRSPDTLGPILTERATTSGAGKLSVGMSYTHSSFKRFEGDRIDDLELTFRHEDVPGDFAFEEDVVSVDLDIEVEQDILALFGTYGLTDRWDIGLVVPLVRVEARADAVATVNGNTALHHFGPGAPDDPVSKTGGTESGLGDVLVRTKYNFLKSHQSWPDAAALVQVQLPTGDEDDLLGRGEAGVLGMLVLSKRFGNISPHLNLGYEAVTEDDLRNVRYAAGFDVRASDRFTTAIDLIGRWHPDESDLSTIDVALGAKWEIVENLPVFANILVPLNPNNGLRPDFVWAFGLQYTF